MRSLFVMVGFVVIVPAAAAQPIDNAMIVDAIGEVNAQRATRGLYPFERDEGLTVAAMHAAAHRARFQIAGHTPNDFSFLPPGVGASAAGCGALTDEWGFAACCTYDNYRYAGAAWARGRCGRRFNHIFVSNAPSGYRSITTTTTTTTSVRQPIPLPQPMAVPPPVAVQSAPAAVQYGGGCSAYGCPTYGGVRVREGYRFRARW